MKRRWEIVGMGKKRVQNKRRECLTCCESKQNKSRQHRLRWLNKKCRYLRRWWSSCRRLPRSNHNRNTRWLNFTSIYENFDMIVISIYLCLTLHDLILLFTTFIEVYIRETIYLHSNIMVWKYGECYFSRWKLEFLNRMSAVPYFSLPPHLPQAFGLAAINL